MENLQTEKVFYQSGHVTVSQSRFIAQDRTYAMRNISSVTIFEIRKSKSQPIAMLVLAAVIALIGGWATFIGLTLIVLSIIWLLSLKNEYAVRISTNAGESNSLLSTNKQYIQSVVNALNEAIIFRG